MVSTAARVTSHTAAADNRRIRRETDEINQDRFALKAIRGDFEGDGEAGDDRLARALQAVGIR